MVTSRIYIHVLAWAMLVVAALAVDELVMVQLVWRHGDRTPTKTFPNDPTQEKDWHNGFGQLTAKGMEQQMILGNLLYDEYVVKNKFLSTSMKFNEMFIRSTDVNRTFISAYSNMYGMYYNRTEARPGVDYPVNPRWPGIMVPFPVHANAVYDEDHVGNPLAECPRREWLWEQAKKTPEMSNFIHKTQDLFNKLTNMTGATIDIDNVWYVRDVIFIEKIHNKTILAGMEELFPQLDHTVDVLENFEEGLGFESGNPINFRVEIPKVRGGKTLWSIIDHFDLKLFCRDPANTNKYECKWMKNLKYYAYSAHDTTISSLMATLGVKDVLVPVGFPEYSSCLVMELWNTSSGPALRMLYHSNYTVGFNEFTRTIDGCENFSNGKCPYNTVRSLAQIFYPGTDMKILCDDTVSLSTNMSVPPTSTTVPPTTTTSGTAGSRASLLSIAMLLGAALKMA